MYILQIKKVCTHKLFGLLLVSAWLLNFQNTQAQSDFLSTQYMNNQLLINPAYAGVRNAFSASVHVRKQWMGIKGAPTTYLLSAHSPLNKKMASLGGSFLNYQNGPIQQSELTFAYSYLLRLNHQMFVSLGLSGQISHYNIGLSSLDVIEADDPSFNQDIKNGFKPNFGVGAFLYSPQFYVGLSMPQALVSELSDDNGPKLKQFRSMYLASGYAFGIGKSIFLKPSVLARFRQEASNAIDLNLQMLYKNIFWIGASYRVNSSAAALLNIQASENIAICYSYDFSINDQTKIGGGSHEISLLIETDKFLRKNRDRRFNKKKVVKKDEDKGVQSIRYF